MQFWHPHCRDCSISFSAIRLSFAVFPSQSGVMAPSDRITTVKYGAVDGGQDVNGIREL